MSEASWTNSYYSSLSSLNHRLESSISLTGLLDPTQLLASRHSNHKQTPVMIYSKPETVDLELINRQAELPEDLACFLQQQKQRQARMETTMRSFPSTQDLEHTRLENKRKRSTQEDPPSHRVIEKRRRDRMNSCLADLSRLIPTSYSKKGRGRLEKTEIIEMAIKHIENLHAQGSAKEERCAVVTGPGVSQFSKLESFRVGYHECLTEAIHYLVEKEGLYSGDSLYLNMRNHLIKHFDHLGKASIDDVLNRVDKPWAASSYFFKTNKEDRGEDTVKSENSEESGYFSVKQEEDQQRASVFRDHQEADTSTSGGAPHLADHSQRVGDYVVLNHTGFGDMNLVGRGEEEEEEAVGEEQGGARRRSSILTAPTQADRRSFSHERTVEDPTRYDEKMDYSEEPSDLSRKFDSDPTDTVGGNLYKFKTNIHQRFREQDEVPGIRQRTSSEAEYKAETVGRAESGHLVIKERPYSEDGPHLVNGSTPHHQQSRSAPQEPEGRCPSPAPICRPTDQLEKTVPIFVLNSRGSYYVPMTVDVSVITPYLSLYTEVSCPILHPVTISVNFQSVHVPSSVEPQRSGVIQQPSVIKHWRDQTGV